MVRRKIEGQHHPLAKTIRRMVRSGELAQDGFVLLETVRLMEDALASGVPIPRVLVSTHAVVHLKRLLERLPKDTTVYELSPKVFETLGSTETGQGILGLAEEPRWQEDDLFPPGRPPLILVLARLQDPGNLGTLLRTAEAFGATGVLLTQGTVSPFNAKAIRATAGALFRIPMLRGLPVAAVLAVLRRRRVKLFTSVVAGGTPLPAANLTGPAAVVFGAEGAGAPLEFRAVGEPLTIPLAAPVESLNVASAAAVILYEIARQREAVVRKAVVSD